MKTRTLSILTITASVGLTASPLFAQATAVTAPVGYRTETLKGGVFNLLAPDLSQAVSAAGALESADAAGVTDAEAAFDTALTNGVKYFVLITSGSSSGVSSPITSWTATNLATADNISAGIVAGNTYEVRATQTLNSLFGTANSAGLAANSNSTLADLVWVPNGAGGYNFYYYNPTAGGFPPKTVGWKSTLTGDTDQGNAAVAFTDGIYIQTRPGADKNVVFTGHVVKTEPVMVLANGFNTLSRVLPVGVTLAQSGLSAFIAQNSNSSLADLVWNPDGMGGNSFYYYNPTAGGFPPKTVGWKSTLTGDTDQGGVVISSGFLIQTRGAGGSAKLSYPTNLDLGN